MLKAWFREGRALAHLKRIDDSLSRIASALEEQNLSRGGGNLGLRTFYQDDKLSTEEADIQFPSDEYYLDLELLEKEKRKQGGEAADLTDEEVEGVLR